MQRFLIRGGNLWEDFFVEDRTFLNQLNKVLRIKVGDTFVFFDGEDDIDYVYEVKEILKNRVVFVFLEEKEKEGETHVVNIFQSLPNKLEKLEYILQKWVEVGVSNFYFFRSERSQKLTLSENKKTRLDKIMREAVEQSGRNTVPNIIFEENLDLDILEGANFFLHTKNNNSKNLNNISLKKNEIVNIFIGPEGGFSESEIEIFTEKKFTGLYLGKNILRSETAGVVTSFFLIQKFYTV